MYLQRAVGRRITPVSALQGRMSAVVARSIRSIPSAARPPSTTRLLARPLSARRGVFPPGALYTGHRHPVHVSSAAQRTPTTARRVSLSNGLTAVTSSPSPCDSTIRGHRVSCLPTGVVPRVAVVAAAHFTSSASDKNTAQSPDSSVPPPATPPPNTAAQAATGAGIASDSATATPTASRIHAHVAASQPHSAVAAAAVTVGPPPPISVAASHSSSSPALSSADVHLLSSALAPSVPSAAPKPTASPPPLQSDSASPPPAVYLSVPFAPMPSAAASSLPAQPDPLEAFASQQSDQPTVDSTKDPTAPLNIPAMPDLPPTQTSSPPSHTRTADTTSTAARSARDADRHEEPRPVPSLLSSAAATGPSSAPRSSSTSSSSSASTVTSPSSVSSPPTALPSSPLPSSQSVERDGVTSDSFPASSNGSVSLSVSSDLSSSAPTTVPSFLRPAELSLWSRIKLHPLFKHWPNIGYLISAVSVLVSDILWLRSLLICANCFGILVNRSFNFWTGIYWNIFFICANLLQIVLILIDRRQVQLSEEEQRVYDLVFADVFSPQEFRKLTKAGHMEDKPAGVELMTQGKEIDLVYLIVDGLVVVEEERKVAVQKQVAVSRSGSGVASAVSGLVSSSSPSLLSYVFGSAGDDRAHGLMADDSNSAGAVTHTQGHTSPGPSQDQPVASAADSRHRDPLSPTTETSDRDADPHSPGSFSSLVPPAAPSDGGLVQAVRDVAQRGAQVLDQLTGLHQPAQHVASLHEPTDAEQQHQYQQMHAQHSQHTLHSILDKHAGQQQHSLPTQPTPTTDTTAALFSIRSPAPELHTTQPSASVALPLPASPSADLSLGSLSSSTAAEVPPSRTDQERDRKRQDRRAKRERRRREKQSGLEGQLGSSGLPSKLVSVSADGSYEIRRETIGFMRSGRLVGEMSLLTTTAPTAASKARNNDEAATATVDTAAGPANSSTSAASATASSSTSSSASLLSSLPSPSDLLSPTSITSSSPTVASASVSCVEPCRVLVWRREALRSLFFRFPSLSVGWHATVSSDLVARLSEARHLSLHNGYKLLLLGICAEGSVTNKQRIAADEYRRLNGISEEDHQRTLSDLGWTESEWQKGTKKQSWMDAIRAGLPAARRASL